MANPNSNKIPSLQQILKTKKEVVSEEQQGAGLDIINNFMREFEAEVGADQPAQPLAEEDRQPAETETAGGAGEPKENYADLLGEEGAGEEKTEGRSGIYAGQERPAQQEHEEEPVRTAQTPRAPQAYPYEGAYEEAGAGAQFRVQQPRARGERKENIYLSFGAGLKVSYDSGSGLKSEIQQQARQARTPVQLVIGGAYRLAYDDAEGTAAIKIASASVELTVKEGRNGVYTAAVSDKAKKFDLVVEAAEETQVDAGCCLLKFRKGEMSVWF